MLGPREAACAKCPVGPNVLHVPAETHRERRDPMRVRGPGTERVTRGQAF